MSRKSKWYFLLICSFLLIGMVPDLNIHLFSYPDIASRDRALSHFRSSRRVVAASPNRRVFPRAEPNDDRYLEDQGNLARVGYEQAWDLTPGGRTAEGEEIVVAVLDAGFDLDHPDLAPNLWINPAETLDGMDNDGNGYVDDIYGWDMIGNDRDIPDDTHGAQVIGILGAKGNNGLGVAGTNWDIKMMLFSISSVADIVEAYGYIIDQRRLYNSTNGQQGALVVATNASFGVEGGTCSQYPVWGGLYDDLGGVGILTAASTVNRDVDVDFSGDMPTDCPSDYLVGVANLGLNDRLFRSSGYGRESVDLAAPGEGSYSTRLGGTYGAFASTSAAAERRRSDPAGTALLIRDALLSGTLPNANLQFRTSSGGSLDVAEAQRRLSENCATGEQEDFAITAVTPNPATDVIMVETNAIVFSDGALVDLYDGLGQRPVRVSSAPVQLAVNLRGLPPGCYTLRLEERERVAVTKVVVQ